MPYPALRHLIVLAQKLGQQIDKLPQTEIKQKLKSINNEIRRWASLTGGTRPPRESNESINRGNRKLGEWKS
jgi:hypothetical protein